MVQKNKWMDGLSSDALVSTAARRTLKARLQLVRYYLPLAAQQVKHDEAAVHQIRVSTRRAMAAVEVYEDLLPPGRARWIKKQLGKIRKAAGDARDYDVLTARLTRLMETDEDSAPWKALLERIDLMRNEAQRPIEKIHKRLRRDDFKDRVRQLCKKVSWSKRHEDAEPSLADSAVDRMLNVIEPFFAASRSDLSDIEALHQFRIQGKALRYAMEIFGCAFPDSFRAELYPQVAQLQAKLGEVNDHASALDRFGRWLVSWDDPLLLAPLQQLHDTEQAELRRTRQEFFQWWTPERAAALEHAFEEHLSQPVAGRVA